jgi:hypothetical protein
VAAALARHRRGYVAGIAICTTSLAQVSDIPWVFGQGYWDPMLEAVNPAESATMMVMYMLGRKPGNFRLEQNCTATGVGKPTWELSAIQCRGGTDVDTSANRDNADQVRGQSANRSRSTAMSCELSLKGANTPSPH